MNGTFKRAAELLREQAAMVRDSETYHSGPLKGKMDPGPTAEVEEHERLAEQLETSASSETDTKALYDELLYAVARKFPGETRHQTALRYIHQAERQDDRAAQAMSQALNEGDGSYKP